MATNGLVCGSSEVVTMPIEAFIVDVIA